VVEIILRVRSRPIFQSVKEFIRRFVVMNVDVVIDEVWSGVHVKGNRGVLKEDQAGPGPF
jgi:hypothetical protein